MVVHGEPGMDEVSPLGVTTVLEVKNGKVNEWEIDPARFGMRNITTTELAGSEPEVNARTIVDVLAGNGSPGARAAVILNAGGAIYLSGLGKSFDEGVEAATAALDAGQGTAALGRLRTASASL
jgi:anthranilate phosphoribosyltransferase